MAREFRGKGKGKGQGGDGTGKSFGGKGFDPYATERKRARTGHLWAEDKAKSQCVLGLPGLLPVEKNRKRRIALAQRALQ